MNFHLSTCKTEQADLQLSIKAEITDAQRTELHTQECHRTEGRSIKEGLMFTPVTGVSQDLDEVVTQLGLPSLMLGQMKTQINVLRSLFDSAQTSRPAQGVSILPSCWNLFLPRRLPTELAT